MLNVLTYADDIVLIGKNETEVRQLFVEMEKTASKFRVLIKLEKTKYMTVERENSLKHNKMGHLKIKK
jgi:hypothetical protein